MNILVITDNQTHRKMQDLFENYDAVLSTCCLVDDGNVYSCYLTDTDVKYSIPDFEARITRYIGDFALTCYVDEILSLKVTYFDAVYRPVMGVLLALKRALQKYGPVEPFEVVVHSHGKAQQYMPFFMAEHEASRTLLYDRNAAVLRVVLSHLKNEAIGYRVELYGRPSRLGFASYAATRSRLTLMFFLKFFLFLARTVSYAKIVGVRAPHKRRSEYRSNGQVLVSSRLRQKSEFAARHYASPDQTIFFASEASASRSSNYRFLADAGFTVYTDVDSGILIRLAQYLSTHFSLFMRAILKVRSFRNELCYIDKLLRYGFAESLASIAGLRMHGLAFSDAIKRCSPRDIYVTEVRSGESFIEATACREAGYVVRQIVDCNVPNRLGARSLVGDEVYFRTQRQLDSYQQMYSDSNCRLVSSLPRWRPSPDSSDRASRSTRSPKKLGRALVYFSCADINIDTKVVTSIGQCASRFSMPLYIKPHPRDFYQWASEGKVSSVLPKDLSLGNLEFGADTYVFTIPGAIEFELQQMEIGYYLIDTAPWVDAFANIGVSLFDVTTVRLEQIETSINKVIAKA